MASDTSKRRSYAEETTFIRETGKVRHEYNIDIGFVPNMRVPVRFYANETLYPLLTGELKLYSENPSGRGGFLPGLKQMANVAALPGIVGASVGLPDCHSGYGFAIGNVAAFDGADPSAVVSPGGVGFDINCGVRLLRTNLSASDLGVRGYGDDDDDRGGVGVGGEIATSPPSAVCESLCQKLFDHIPVGVGSRGVIPSSPSDLEASLALGMDWSLREGYAWAEDKEHCEEQGRMLTADASAVSRRAKKRGLPQLGTLGAGNHYCEVQVVDEVMDRAAAERMGIGRRGQVCVMIHSGSRGLGHQVATDALVAMDSSSSSAAIATNDRQLACARISGEAGQRYLRSMAAAANYAWVNRSAMTFLARQAFAKEFSLTPDDLEMGVVYDVSHNIAKWEEHVVGKEEQAALFHGGAAVLGAGANAAAAAAAAKTAPSNLGKTGGWGMPRRLLVHRKGATRAFPPLHPLVPVDYQLTGQPVLIGGTMGTCSYVLTGSELGMQRSFGSTCHGAGRAKSRAASRRTLDYDKVLGGLHKRGISIRVASPKLVMEEAPESYKDVSAVVRTCEEAGISSTAVRLRPVAVVKG